VSEARAIGATERSSALSVRDIEKSFGPTPVLKGVSFDVARGRVHALLGENGAGKSTLMNILVGLVRADRGSALASGAPLVPQIANAADARRAGVVMVPQERTLCLHLDVVDNLVLGVEPSRAGFVSGKRAREEAAKALALVVGDSARISLDARTGDLSVADQQLVEIARALVATKLSLLILDEPTSSLGADDAKRLFSRIQALKESGVGILLVTHFLSDVRDHADDYTVLRDGKVAGSGDPKTTPAEQIVHEMLGRALEKEERAAAAESTTRDASKDVLLRVRDLAGTKKPKRASFELRRGEIFGIAGLVGSGRTELLRAVLGLDARRSGDVALTAPRGAGLLSEDRGGEGLMLARSIGENVTLSPRGSTWLGPAAVRDAGARAIRELGVKATDPDQPAGELSGGNQQKVQIARMLREDFDVLLVDEPTRGIDVEAKANVLSLFRDLARRGKGIVLVSSQLDELVAVCDRIAVLKGGELGDARPARECTSESLLVEASS
jgi:ribose transport system ATP-binding protein